MKKFDQNILKEAKKKSEESSRKFKIAGRIIAYLSLIIFFGIGVLIFRDLGRELVETVDLYRSALILIIIIGFSFLSIWISKKKQGEESYFISPKIIRLIITIFMFLSIYILLHFTRNT